MRLFEAVIKCPVAEDWKELTSLCNDYNAKGWSWDEVYLPYLGYVGFVFMKDPNLIVAATVVKGDTLSFENIPGGVQWVLYPIYMAQKAVGECSQSDLCDRLAELVGLGEEGGENGN